MISENRKTELLWNIEGDDYFGTLATRINIIKIENDISHSSDKLLNIIEELNHLQENYKIIPK